MQTNGGNQKSIKDITNSIKDIYIPVSYTKINKLIMALYMVTDIIDEKESVRNRLRTLGSELITDILSVSYKTEKDMILVINKVSEVLTFLEIASTVRIISQMNYSILKKEFLDLKKSIQDYKNSPNFFADRMSVLEFLKDDEPLVRNDLRAPVPKQKNSLTLQKNIPIGHLPPTKLGVQKGSTLLQALSDRVSDSLSVRKDSTVSDRKVLSVNDSSNTSTKTKNKVNEKLDILREKRKEQIISLLKSFPYGATMSDIKRSSRGELAFCSEKTLQRDLIILVKDSVLYKKGSKRWSKYFLK